MLLFESHSAQAEPAVGCGLDLQLPEGLPASTGSVEPPPGFCFPRAPRCGAAPWWRPQGASSCLWGPGTFVLIRSRGKWVAGGSGRLAQPFPAADLSHAFAMSRLLVINPGRAAGGALLHLARISGSPGRNYWFVHQPAGNCILVHPLQTPIFGLCPRGNCGHTT